MRRKLIILMAIILVIAENRVSLSQQLDSVWSVIWPGPERRNVTQEAVCVQEKIDGNLILYGFGYNNGNANGSIVRTYTMSGDYVQSTYAIPTNGRGNWLEPTEDNGCAILSFYPAFGRMDFTKLDNGMDDEWTQRFQFFISNYPEHFCKMGDEGYLIVGRAKTDDDFYAIDALMVATDLQGDTLWTRLYGEEGYWDSAHWVTPLSDGNYLVVGETNSFDVENTNSFLLKITPEGETIWVTLLGEEFSPRPGAQATSAFEKANGDIIVGGTALGRFTSEGEPIWIQPIYTKNIVEAHDGGIMIIARDFEMPADSLNVIKTDESGEIQWIKSFYNELTFHGESISRTSDGGYAIAGFKYIREYEFGQLLMKLSSEFEVSLSIPLQSNYFNLVSFPVQPYFPAISRIVENIADLVIVYNDQGNVYIPENGIDTIEDIDVGEAYRLFGTTLDTLTIRGVPVDLTHEYSLEGGMWNWLGHPFNEQVLITEAMNTIAEVIQIVISDDGRIWIPELDLNTIEFLQPGEGLMVLPFEDVTFQYTIPDQQFGRNRTYPNEIVNITTDHTLPSISNGKPYAIIVELEERIQAQNPSLIKVYDGDLLVGEAILQENQRFNPMVAWENDEKYGLPGFVAGDSIIIKVFDEQGRLIAETDKTSEMHTFGDGAYAEISLSERKQDGTLPTEFTVENVYPNPFNNTTTVPFSLPEAEKIRFTLLNVLGQEVYSHQGRFNAGYHKFTLNLGDGFSNPGSGVYFLKVSLANQSRMQKVILLQ
ncbi:T9SS type A sorting domain-containing protein [bacterium]|nr:T9SS type A sorting domain-containing protein [bacterium]